MKRFFCTKCNRIVRTRKLPPLEPQAYPDNGETLQPAVRLRTGTCRWHDGPPRRTAMDRVRVVARIGKTSKMLATSAKTKSK